jgi:hypothetical protein
MWRYKKLLGWLLLLLMLLGGTRLLLLLLGWLLLLFRRRLERIGTAFSTPYCASDVPHVLGSHDIAVPYNTARLAVERGMQTFAIGILDVLKISLFATITDLYNTP